MYSKQFGILLHRNELFVEPLSKELHYTLAQSGGRQGKLFYIVVKRELQIGVSKYHPVELVQDMAHLHRIGLEEVAPCRYIEKQMLHSNRGATTGHHGRLFRYLVTLYLQESTYLLSFLASD